MSISAQNLNNLFVSLEHLCLLMIRDIFITAEIVSDEFDHRSRKQEYADQVRDSHESVESLSDLRWRARTSLSE